MNPGAPNDLVSATESLRSELKEDHNSLRKDINSLHQEMDNKLNKTTEEMKGVSERVDTGGGRWGRDCGAERSAHRVETYSKQADLAETVPDSLELGKKRKGRFQTPYTRIWIHWEDRAVYTAPHMKPASSCTVLITSPLGERFGQLHTRALYAIFAITPIQHAMSQPLQFIRREKRHQQQEQRRWTIRILSLWKKQDTDFYMKHMSKRFGYKKFHLQLT